MPKPSSSSPTKSWRVTIQFCRPKTSRSSPARLLLFWRVVEVPESVVRMHGVSWVVELIEGDEKRRIGWHNGDIEVIEAALVATALEKEMKNQ